MKTETEILGELDALLAQLDDAAKERAMAWLRAKHLGPKAAVTQRLTPFEHPMTVPFPFIPVTEQPFPPPPWSPGLPGILGSPYYLGDTITIEGRNWPSVAGCNPTTLGQVWTGESRTPPELLAQAFESTGVSGFRPSGMH